MNKKLIIILISFVTISLFGVYLLTDKNETDNLVITNEIETVTTPTVSVDAEVEIDPVVKPVLTPTPTDIILFYGDGCPHCVRVEEFIESNQIKEKISFSQKEVYNDRKNSDELMDKARICGISINSIGVPFLWDGTKCFVGYQDVIEFFKLKIN